MVNLEKNETVTFKNKIWFIILRNRFFVKKFN